MAAPMRPTDGSVDVWYWKAGGTNPIAYAEDWSATTARDLGPDVDMSGTPGDKANLAALGGAQFYKDPLRSQIYRPFGTDSTVLDSMLYLLATASARMEGNATAGDAIYLGGVGSAVPACVTCHGADGKAQSGTDLEAVGRTWSLGRFQDFIARPDSFAHPDLRGLSFTNTKDILSRLRAFSRIPSRTLARPLGSAADLRVPNWDATYSPDGLYTVVFKRKLGTTFSDDRVLDLDHVHPFALAVMDRDDVNHSGSRVLYLTFVR
jgi:hypothetical protein